MPEHDAKVAKIHAGLACLRGGLEDQRRDLDDLLDGLPFGDPARAELSRQLSETEDLIQELDCATDGKEYNG